MHVEDITNELQLPTGKLFAFVRGDSIPSAIFIGVVRINITYPGMERKCRRICQSPERECFNCHKKDTSVQMCQGAVRENIQSRHLGLYETVVKETPQERPRRNHRTRINLCLACTATLGMRPAYHACAAHTQASPPADSWLVYASCSAAFPNRRGLINHLQAHDRQRLVEARGAAHPSHATTAPSSAPSSTTPRLPRTSG